MLYTLALESSWATRFITSFLRSAITFQVSVNVHVLAIILREHLVTFTSQMTSFPSYSSPLYCIGSE